VTNRAKD